eukprot:sb/3477651/
MLAFYKKRFSLSAPMKQIPIMFQPNNFVVFRDFFKSYVPTSNKRWPDQHNRGPIKLKAVERPPSGKKVIPAPVRAVVAQPVAPVPARQPAAAHPPLVLPVSVPVWN